MKIKKILNPIKLGYQQQLKRISIAELKTIPNLLTLFRIGSVPIIAILYILGLSNPVMMISSLGLFGISAFTDCLDGVIARKFNLQTETGKALDAFADKFFLLSLTPMLFLHPNILVRILLGLTAINEMAITAINGYGSYHHCKVSSSQVGKLKTWFLFGSGALLMLSNILPEFLVLAMGLSIINIQLELKTVVTYFYDYYQEVLERENEPLMEEKNNTMEEDYQVTDSKTTVYHYPSYEKEKIKVYRKQNCHK